MDHLKISFLDPAHSWLVHCVPEPLAVKSSNLAVVSHLVVDQVKIWTIQFEIFSSTTYFLKLTIQNVFFPTSNAAKAISALSSCKQLSELLFLEILISENILKWAIAKMFFFRSCLTIISIMNLLNDPQPVDILVAAASPALPARSSFFHLSENF